MLNTPFGRISSDRRALSVSGRPFAAVGTNEFPGYSGWNPNFNPQYASYMLGGADASGACGPMSAAQQAMYQAACANREAAARQASRSVVLSKSPQIALGINSIDVGAGTIIAAGASRTLSISPTVPMCLTDFDVSRSCAAFFLIDSMRTARQEFLADGAGLAADNFAPDSIHPPLQLPTLVPGTNITLVVRNIDTADHHFFAQWWGIPGQGAGPCL